MDCMLVVEPMTLWIELLNLHYLNKVGESTLQRKLKKEVTIPVITVGSIREPQFVENILAEGKADFVAIGRGLIADPEWVNKTMEGREAEIRKCINCLHCIHSVSANSHILCTINARAGRELEFNELQCLPADVNRQVVIVGGDQVEWKPHEFYH